LLRQIRVHAVALASDPPRDKIGLQLEVDADLESPFRRAFWMEPTHFQTSGMTDYEADQNARRQAFLRLAAMHRLDWKEMRNQIRRLVDLKGTATLGELLKLHPPKGGVIEVLGYLQIARDDQHLVNPLATQRVVVPATREQDRALVMAVPLVTFTLPKRDTDARRPS